MAKPVIPQRLISDSDSISTCSNSINHFAGLDRIGPFWSFSASKSPNYNRTAYPCLLIWTDVSLDDLQKSMSIMISRFGVYVNISGVFMRWLVDFIHAYFILIFSFDHCGA